MATICEEFSTRANGANFVNLKGQQLHLNAAYQVKKKEMFSLDTREQRLSCV